MSRLLSVLLPLLCSSVLSGCGFGLFLLPPNKNAALVQGPPIENVQTPFDTALSCLRGKIRPGVVFGVGQVIDATGKETYSEGGTGKFISQGAGEMVQSALFSAGVTLVNRRDSGVTVTETQWGIRNLEQQLPVNFFVSGSINSIDFIPGGGFSANVNGIGPRARQNRILVALDLNMTDAFTGRIVANVPLQKQIYTREFGIEFGRFVNETLITFDAGGQEREAIHFALRQMLSLATFQLLGSMVTPATYEKCSMVISSAFGSVGDESIVNRDAISAALLASSTAANTRQDQLANQEQAKAAENSLKTQLSKLKENATLLAIRAIAAAETSLAEDDAGIAAEKAAEATKLISAAGQFLKRAAELGLTGAEGDALAVVVERGFNLSSEAYEKASSGMQNDQVNRSHAPTDEAVQFTDE